MRNVDERECNIIKVIPPKKKEIITVRILIAAGIITMLAFVHWFVSPDHIGNTTIFWLLTFALLFKLVKMLHEWYHYWSVSVPSKPQITRQWTVDVLTTACPGEPVDMIVRTLKAMKEIRYPHTSYLCDEGDDPFLKKVCDELGIVHVTRKIKIDAKAGNINNALKQAKGEICIILDPDHVPVPEFIDRVLPYFEDPSIGFVQCVQAYSNQSESFIAKGAAEQTYHFYGPMMMCMNSYGTVQAIGANCTFRRSALDSIGGHAAGLSEDMHTAMQLHAKGWKSVYVPEILTRGLVPATLSSYYKQQLKWSRGTFELLFRTYPALKDKFTWRQKIHYFTIPLYFLFGLINLIDIAVPVLALSLAEVPWEVNLGKFAAYFLPLCGLSMIIRLYAQRWLLEKHERGFHLAGGILRTGTWWIFLIGFIYTILKIKVPYIPTPKEDEHRNYWRLSLVNLFVALTVSAAVVYGLSIDWTPYSFAMAFYALLNVIMLSFLVLVSQQKLLCEINRLVTTLPAVNTFFRISNSMIGRGQQVVYGFLRNGPVAILVGIAMMFLSYTNSEENDEIKNLRPKDFGGFYTGVVVPDENDLLSGIKSFERFTGNASEVAPVHRGWDSDAEELIPNVLTSHATMPFIEWDPFSLKDPVVLKNISAGRYDAYLETCALSIRKYREPVCMSFAPAYPDQSEIVSVNSHDFIRAWQYVYTFFNNLGVSNITWIWCPASTQGGENYYPGPKFVDWIGVSCLNYGKAPGSHDWYSFADIYEGRRSKLGSFQKPVMITRLGSVRSEHQDEWFRDAFGSIKEKYREVRSAIVFTGVHNIPVDSTVYVADFALHPSASTVLASSLRDQPFSNGPFFAAKRFEPVKPSHSHNITGGPGHYTLTADGKPFYIRGVAYNTAHDWRDGNLPLTRRQVEKDFRKITEMGANTIRRYDHGIYDRNVLNIASEYKLRVLFGFWFDPKVDYYADSARVQEYLDEVEEKVLAYRDHEAVLAWSLGNETWGLLKHRYAKPYLVKVRDSYVRMIEKLAERIHEIDPSRPVFSCMEHEEYQLPGELVALRDGAPSIDVIGVNSYYREQISNLNHVTWEFDSLRPYLVSEFGPRGYWDPTYNRTEKGKLKEDSEKEKAAWYQEQWSSYVAAYSGYNIGGFAYCWHDRMEGTYTWFGLTDYRSRPKPAYYALKELWTKKPQQLMADHKIVGPSQIVPGGEYIFRAVSSEAQKNYKYEWQLLKDDYLKKVDNITITGDPAVVKVSIPKSRSDYRLYLYVSDESGNVTTASAAIPVR